MAERGTGGWPRTYRTYSWRERVRSILSAAEVAAYCGVTERRVVEWIEAGLLPARSPEIREFNVEFAHLWAFLERRSLLGSERSFTGRAVLAAEPGPC